MDRPSKASSKIAKRLPGVERRMQILEKAGRLFAAKGLHGTTTREIALAAGVSEPVLYQHFKSKEDIYGALEKLCSQQTASFKRLLRDFRADTDCLIVMTYLLVRVISYCKEPGVESEPDTYAPAEVVLRLMGHSLLSDGRFARVIVETCIGAFFDQWADSYRASLAEGDLDVERADETILWVAYESLVGCGFFVLPDRRMVDRVKDAEESAKAATLFLLRGLGVKSDVLREKVNWPSLRKIYQAGIATE